MHYKPNQLAGLILCAETYRENAPGFHPRRQLSEHNTRDKLGYRTQKLSGPATPSPRSTRKPSGTRCVWCPLGFGPLEKGIQKTRQCLNEGVESFRRQALQNLRCEPIKPRRFASVTSGGKLRRTSAVSPSSSEAVCLWTSVAFALLPLACQCTHRVPYLYKHKFRIMRACAQSSQLRPSPARPPAPLSPTREGDPNRLDSKTAATERAVDFAKLGHRSGDAAPPANERRPVALCQGALRGYLRMLSASCICRSLPSQGCKCATETLASHWSGLSQTVTSCAIAQPICKSVDDVLHNVLGLLVGPGDFASLPILLGRRFEGERPPPSGLSRCTMLCPSSGGSRRCWSGKACPNRCADDVASNT